VSDAAKLKPSPSLVGRLLAVPRLFWALLTSPFRLISRAFSRLRRFLTEDPDDISLTETIGSSFESRQSFFELLGGFGEHLNALRVHLTRAVIVLAAMVALVAWQADTVIAVLSLPLTGRSFEMLGALWAAPTWETLAPILTAGTTAAASLVTREPTEGLGTFMRVALLGGLVLAFPWIVAEVYLFIAPGLMAKTRVRTLAAIPIATGLFLSGVAFAYLVMLPVAIPFLRDSFLFQDAWTPSAYFGLATNVMLWVGIAFEMPLIIFVLASFGLVKPKQLLDYWRFAFVGIAILAAVITPTTDPVNMALVMAPLILLYGVSIIAAWFAARGRRGMNSANGQTV
jgi:sec-independent protein translocase protein TatC